MVNLLGVHVAAAWHLPGSDLLAQGLVPVPVIAAPAPFEIIVPGSIHLGMQPLPWFARPVLALACSREHRPPVLNILHWSLYRRFVSRALTSRFPGMAVAPCLGQLACLLYYCRVWCSMNAGLDRWRRVFYLYCLAA